MSCRVFIVEDDKAHATLMDLCLKNARGSYNTELFQSGEVALEEAIRNPPDLMLVDINLIDMSGIELLEQISKHKDFKTRVILLSSQEFDYGVVVKCTKLGASDFLQKTKVLLSPTSRHLELKVVKALLEPTINLADREEAEKLIKENARLKAQARGAKKLAVRFGSLVSEWFFKAILAGVAAAVFTWLVTQLQPGKVQIALLVGGIVFVFVIVRNPLRRFANAFWALLTVWSSACLVSSFSIAVEHRDSFLDIWFSGQELWFHIVAGVLMLSCLILDFVERRARR
ncbi:hypothetical protein HAHE_19960 [Haloferula helveola]|uniref:Response regulatory domain-containing protein n=1 Tax=Haloferula helveola TaxID=490095 RepID=A0ABM7RDW5_9BACT|nr:hypothetical protein HAHE_19960 [Haloferula helveola]